MPKITVDVNDLLQASTLVGLASLINKLGHGQPNAPLILSDGRISLHVPHACKQQLLDMLGQYVMDEMNKLGVVLDSESATPLDTHPGA